MSGAPASLIVRSIDSRGRACVVKQLRPEDAGREDLALRLENERRVLEHLREIRGVIRLWAVERDPLRLVLDFADGGSLDQQLTAGLGTDDRYRFARELIAALRAIHARGVVHRDIKPSNLLIVAGTLTIADFGVAAWGNPRRAVPVGWTEDQVGTPPWSAPELRRDASAATDPSVDVYSAARVIGVLLPGLANGALLECVRNCTRDDPRDRPGLEELGAALG